MCLYDHDVDRTWIMKYRCLNPSCLQFVIAFARGMLRLLYSMKRDIEAIIVICTCLDDKRNQSSTIDGLGVFASSKLSAATAMFMIAGFGPTIKVGCICLKILVNFKPILLLYIMCQIEVYCCEIEICIVEIRNAPPLDFEAIIACTSKIGLVDRQFASWST